MGTLTFEVKDFIQDNIDLIKERAWSQIYYNAAFNLDSESIGAFTVAMLAIGENPLDSLDYIPDYYLSDTKIESFNIPNHIQELGEGCFSYSSLKEIVIPDSVTSIGKFAFYQCPQLKRVTIPSTVQNIESSAFSSFGGVILCKEGSVADTVAAFLELNVEYY